MDAEGHTNMKATPKASADVAASLNVSHSPSGDILTAEPRPQQAAAMAVTSGELEKSAPESSRSSAGAGAGDDASPAPKPTQDIAKLPSAAKEVPVSTQEPTPDVIKSAGATEVAVATKRDPSASTEQPVVHVPTKDSTPTKESGPGEQLLAVESPAAIKSPAGRRTSEVEPSSAPRPLPTPKVLALEAAETPLHPLPTPKVLAWETAETPPLTVETKGETVETKGEAAATKEEAVETKRDTVETEEGTVDTKRETVETEGGTADTKGETVETEGETAATKGETVATKGEITETKGETVATKGETVATKEQTAETKGEAVEIKRGDDKAAGNGDGNNPVSVGVGVQESNPAAAVVNASRPKSLDNNPALLMSAVSATKSGLARPRSMLGRPGRAPVKVNMPIVGGRAAWNKFLASEKAEETDAAGAAVNSSSSAADATTTNGGSCKQDGNATASTAASDVGDSLAGAGTERVSEEGVVANGVAGDECVSAVERRGPPRGFKAPVTAEGPNKGPAGAFSGNSMWRLAGGSSSASSAAKNSLAANGHGGYSNPLAAMRANGGAAAEGSASGGAGSGAAENVANPLAGLRGVGGTAGMVRANPLARGSVANPLTRGGAGGTLNPLARGGRSGGPRAGSERAVGGSAAGGGAGGGSAYNVNPLRRGNTTVGLPPAGGSTAPTPTIPRATTDIEGARAMNGGVARDGVVGADGGGAALADGNTARSSATPAQNGAGEGVGSPDGLSARGAGAQRATDFNVVADVDVDVIDGVNLNGGAQHSGFRLIGARGGGVDRRNDGIVPSRRSEKMHDADRDPGQAQVASLVVSVPLSTSSKFWLLHVFAVRSVERR